MKYLKIQNNGELDIRLVALMGGSTKTNDRYKIGKFGTGLKYTLAFLFRENLSFKIFSGSKPIDISLEVEEIGSDSFEIICINQNRTSITTKMGLEWSAWMILRELWCNALDEGGALKTTTHSDVLEGEEGKTTFYIQVNSDIEEVLNNWENYFITKEEPIFENIDYAIYLNDGKPLRLYKNSILIYQNPEEPSLFKYDIKNAEINELREFKGHVHMEIFNALRNPNRETINYFFSNVEEKHYEGSAMDYDWFNGFAQIWKDVIGDKKISYHGGSSGSSEGFQNAENIANVISLPKKIYKALTKAFEGIGAIGMSDTKHEFYESKNIPFEQKINECLGYLIDKGYEYDLNIKFVTGKFADKVKSGTNKKSNKVLISTICADLEYFELACVLVENIEKLKVREDDLKHHFIHKYIQTMIAKTEPKEAAVEADSDLAF